jgi:carboxylesterase
MSEHPVIPGAEPLSAAGDDVGVLVLHGFTGNPGSVRPLAQALAADGRTVELPRLPGHGTAVEDMVETGFADWSAAADAAYADLAGRTRTTVVAGLSMGGTLACWLAASHPEVGGLVVVNPLVQPPEPEMVAMARQMVEAGETIAPGIGSDIADPDSSETAYPGSPLRPLLSLVEAVEALQADLPRIACPVLVMTSPQDHVVPPANSDHLAALVAGPVERVTLERSYHVATLDYDKDLVGERAVAFVRKVAASSSP